MGIVFTKRSVEKPHFSNLAREILDMRFIDSCCEQRITGRINKALKAAKNLLVWARSVRARPGYRGTLRVGIACRKLLIIRSGL